MDHAYIEEHGLVDRYLAGRLPAVERVRFEDHFVDCPRCLDELELARDFQASLAAGVAREVSRKTAAFGLLAWLARPAGRAVLLGAFLVLVAVPAAFLMTGGGTPPPLGPQVNIPTYALGSVRGDDGRVLTSPASEWLSLVLEVDDPERFMSYRLTVSDGAGNEVWRRDGVEPDRRGAVALTFPPGSLAAGDYRLELAGVASAGEPVALETHRFRLTE